jgi:hypothetical protein
MGSEDLVEKRRGLFQNEQGLEEWRSKTKNINKDRLKSMSKILQETNPGANGLGYGQGTGPVKRFNTTNSRCQWRGFSSIKSVKGLDNLL